MAVVRSGRGDRQQGDPVAGALLGVELGAVHVPAAHDAGELDAVVADAEGDVLVGPLPRRGEERISFVDMTNEILHRAG